MNSTEWKGVAELVGIAAIVASLIFVGLQMRQEHTFAQSHALLGWIAIARLLVGWKPPIRRIG